MNIASIIPQWLDAFLIAPYRWPPQADYGMWLGSALLAFYCVVIGEIIYATLYLLHHKYYDSMQDRMIHYHNLSVQALHAGDKEAYLAANKLAKEDFGKSFFAQASIGIASLLPLPFALAWMAARFEGITLYTAPLINLKAGYVFVLLTLYILIRIFFSRTIKKKLPVFRRVEAMKAAAREARGVAKSFFNPGSEAAAAQAAPGADEKKEKERPALPEDKKADPDA